MSNKITLTTAQYAIKCGKSRQHIHRLAKSNKIDLLPGVKNIEKVGRFYLLHVSANFSFPES